MVYNSISVTRTNSVSSALSTTSSYKSSSSKNKSKSHFEKLLLEHGVSGIKKKVIKQNRRGNTSLTSLTTISEQQGGSTSTVGAERSNNNNAVCNLSPVLEQQRTNSKTSELREGYHDSSSYSGDERSRTGEPSNHDQRREKEADAEKALVEETSFDISDIMFETPTSSLQHPQQHHHASSLTTLKDDDPMLWSQQSQKHVEEKLRLQKSNSISSRFGTSNDFTKDSQRSVDTVNHLLDKMSSTPNLMQLNLSSTTSSAGDSSSSCSNEEEKNKELQRSSNLASQLIHQKSNNNNNNNNRSSKTLHSSSKAPHHERHTSNTSSKQLMLMERFIADIVSTFSDLSTATNKDNNNVSNKEKSTSRVYGSGIDTKPKKRRAYLNNNDFLDDDNNNNNNKNNSKEKVTSCLE